jgi:hypothetical protein
VVTNGKMCNIAVKDFMGSVLEMTHNDASTIKFKMKKEEIRAWASIYTSPLFSSVENAARARELFLSTVMERKPGPTEMTWDLSQWSQALSSTGIARSAGPSADGMTERVLSSSSSI